MSSAITLAGLVKRFGSFPALDGLDLDVLRGDLDGRRRRELLDRFELDPTKRARTYSKGNRQSTPPRSDVTCWPEAAPT